MATSDRLPRTTPGLGLPLETYNNFQHDSLTVPHQFSDSASIGSSENVAMKGKKRAGSQHAACRPKAYSSSSYRTYSTQNTHSTSGTQTQNRAAPREARSLPCKLLAHK